MKSYIIFIRHGITEGILKKWFYGWADLKVEPEGYEELEKYKAEGIYPDLPPCARFFTSGLIRTNETLQAIYGDVPFTELSDMREISFGEWECRSYKELSGENGWDEWMNDNEGKFSFPGGESMNEFIERINRGIETLLESHRLTEKRCLPEGEDAVTVMICHGGAISATMLKWFGEDRSEFWNWLPTTGLGYKVYFEDGEPLYYVPLRDWEKVSGELD